LKFFVLLLFIILEWGFVEMKKFISALLAGVMMFGSVCVYAADDTTIEIKTANYNKTSDKVTVTGKLGNGSGSQSITIMSTGIKNGNYDTEKIVYIDQRDNFTVGEDGSFTLEFALSDEATEKVNDKYLVRMGGSNILNPACIGIVFTEGGETEIIYGDVNADGKLNVNDASLLLKYILDPASVTITDKGFENAQIRIEPIEKNEFTAADSAMIMQKVLDDSNFRFPVEKKSQ